MVQKEEFFTLESEMQSITIGSKIEQLGLKQ